MKKIILVLAITFLFLPQLTFGQTITPIDEESSDSVEKKVDQIKDKVTSKVESLNLVEKRGIIGVVESVTENQIKINDLNDKIRIIDVDELTKYDSINSNSFDLSEIETGTKISVLGLYNKDSEKLLARFVNEISIPVFISGVISEKDEDSFAITLTTEDEKDYTIDIENITETFSFSEEDLNPSGFTNIENLQNAIIIGFTDPNDSNTISATRIVIFPDVPKNPRIKIDVATPSTSSSLSPTP